MGSLFGVPVRIHYTWVFIILLLAWTIAEGFLPAFYPGFGLALRWSLEVFMALLLFGSVLVHELAHSLVARHRKLPVQGITLFIFGGVSEIPEEAHEPSTSFLMSFAGPLISLVVGAVFITLYLGLDDVAPAPFIAVFQYLGLVNVVLAGFNLLPAFPLDGGRVLQSGIWAVTGDHDRATLIAANIGKAFAYLMIIGGIALAFTGNIFGGLWIAFIGWFLRSSAEASRRQTQEKSTREQE